MFCLSSEGQSEMTTATEPSFISPQTAAGPLGKPRRRFRVGRRSIGEWIIESLLFLAAASSVVVTFSIVGVLVYESWTFFQHVSIKEFLTGTTWTPLFANP